MLIVAYPAAATAVTVYLQPLPLAILLDVSVATPLGAKVVIVLE